jgi:hypothetical protein
VVSSFRKEKVEPNLTYPNTKTKTKIDPFGSVLVFVLTARGVSPLPCLPL